jgi:hypothetical protein
MARAHRKNGAIRVVQGKTGEELWIPEHRDLAAELARGITGHLSLLTTSQGKAFDLSSDRAPQYCRDVAAKYSHHDICPPNRPPMFWIAG